MKIRLLNFIISFIACKIYKYKMYCRLEEIDETFIGIHNYIKHHVVFMGNLFKYSKNTHGQILFEKLSLLLWNIFSFNLSHCYRYILARGIMNCWAMIFWINSLKKTSKSIDIDVSEVILWYAHDQNYLLTKSGYASVLMIQTRLYLSKVPVWASLTIERFSSEYMQLVVLQLERSCYDLCHRY